MTLPSHQLFSLSLPAGLFLLLTLGQPDDPDPVPAPAARWRPLDVRVMDESFRAAEPATPPPPRPAAPGKPRPGRHYSFWTCIPGCTSQNCTQRTPTTQQAGAKRCSAGR